MQFWINESHKKIKPQLAYESAELRIMDLFSGCGGLSLGAMIACEQLKRPLKIAYAADVWKDAIETYRQNFGEILEQVGAQDLMEMVKFPGSSELSNLGTTLADSLGDVQVILAGPPCQGHSDLNNNSRRDDPRNLLYTIPVAFALKKKVELLVIENVPTVIHAKDDVVNSALAALKDNGYAVIEFLADAQNFGIPQRRKRHLLIASRKHSTLQLQEQVRKIPTRTNDVGIWGFIKDLEQEVDDSASLLAKRASTTQINRDRINYLFSHDIYDLPNSERPACHREKKHSYVSMYGRLHCDRPAQTITSGFGSMGQGRYVHPTQKRTITAHEAARIQGFPDYFDFSRVRKLTALREMIGNAVPPQISAVLLVLLLRQTQPKHL
jgi:DNA (cytosine-5)-methyltransferase 1